MLGPFEIKNDIQKGKPSKAETTDRRSRGEASSTDSNDGLKYHNHGNTPIHQQNINGMNRQKLQQQEIQTYFATTKATVKRTENRQQQQNEQKRDEEFADK